MSFFTFWACVVDGRPMGYVRAETYDEALTKAKAKCGNSVQIYQWDGAL